MNVEFANQGDTLLIRLHENVTFDKVSVFKATLEKIFRERVGGVVFDLSDINYVCSTGLGILIAHMKSVRDTRDRVAVVTAHPKVLKILELVHINKLAAVVRSVDEAFPLVASEGDGQV